MADVFLSYTRNDRGVAVELTQRLEQAGFSVWWDRYIDGGADFGAEIEREIAAAGSVMVLWSRTSQASKWVRDEASYGRDTNKLLPLCIDGTPPPLGFRQVQALDFSAWHGATDAEVFETLVRSLRRMLERRVVPAAPPAPYSRSPAESMRKLRNRAFVVGAVSVLVALGATLAYWRSALLAPGSRNILRGQFEIHPFTAQPPDPDRTARAATYSDAFRNRFTELGIRNVAAAEVRGDGGSEFQLSGEVARDGDKDILTARIGDRQHGTTLWTIRRPPSDGATWESNLAGYAVRCALKRWDRKRGVGLLSRYLYSCAGFLDGDFGEFYLAAKAAYEAAPDDASALALLAVATGTRGYITAISDGERSRYMHEARDLAERALQLDPKNSDAAFAMGISIRDPAFAEQEKWWRIAVESDPGSGWAQGRYGNFLAMVGRNREAMDMELRATENRLNTQIARIARLFAAAGDWRQVAELYDRIRAFDPEGVAARELQTYVMFGDVDTASRLLEQRRDVAGRDAGCWELVLRARRHGTHDREQFATQCGRRVEAPDLHVIAGDIDAAYRAVDSYLASPDSVETPRLLGPHMSAFRHDARFWPLVARLGLVRYWIETDHWPDFCAEPTEPVDCRTAAREAQAALSMQPAPSH